MSLTRTVSISLLMGGGLLVGCESSAPANKNINIERRENNLRTMLAWLPKNEDRHAHNLEGDVAFIGKAYNEDVRQTNQNIATVDHMFQEEFDNWAERQPAWERDLKKWAAGHPERLEPVAKSLIN